MGILGGTPGSGILLHRQECPQFLGFRFPVFILGIKGLGQTAPADIADQALLIFGRSRRGPAFLEPLEGFKGSDIIAEFSLGPALAQPIRFNDAVIDRQRSRLV